MQPTYIILFDFFNAYFCVQGTSIHVFYLGKPVLVNMVLHTGYKQQCQQKICGPA